MLAPLIALVVIAAAGCTLAGARPSTALERTPTPDSVTVDNPAGDAQSPVDAALTRLANEPAGSKSDRFRTLGVSFPDPGNWRRVRFFGHPTRVSFRYGDDAYALAVVKYFASQDDSPSACLSSFIDQAAELADSFDIELGPMAHEIRAHPKGPESSEWQSQRAEDERRRIEARQRWLKARERARAMAKLRRERALARQAQSAAQPPTSPTAVPAGAASTSPAGTALPATSATSAPPPPADSAAPPGAAPDGTIAPAGQTATRAVTMRRLTIPPRPPLPRPAPPPPKPPHDPSGWRIGQSPMPVVTTWGQMQTLSNRDRYLAAVVAYRSWPGTCLVQGFGVKVGSDEALARQVLERWVLEHAPLLAWSTDLRERPPFKNR